MPIIVTFFSPFLLIFLCKTLSNCLFNTYCINYNCACKIREIILLLYKNPNCWTKTIIIMTNSLSHYIVCCILLINCWNKKLILNDWLTVSPHVLLLLVLISPLCFPSNRRWHWEVLVNSVKIYMEAGVNLSQPKRPFSFQNHTHNLWMKQFKITIPLSNINRSRFGYL